MSEQSKKWKARLLSSSLPLEHEVAKILSQHNFMISFDYSYYRTEGNIRKEFSIDIHATAYEPFNNPNKINAQLTIISECKYREEGKIWAFLPEIGHKDYSNFTAGNTIKAVDCFSMKQINLNTLYDFEVNFPFTSKGIEIGLTSGEVFDKDIRHGILQLKYGLPYILKDTIEFNVLNRIDNANPFFIIPILVTNADLYVFTEELTTESIKDIDDINQIATKVPYLIFNSDPGPDFITHHRQIFKKFNKIRFDPNMEIFEDKQKTFKNKALGIYNSPVREVEDLAHSPMFAMHKYYTQFFICSSHNLDGFIKDIQSAVSISLKKSRKSKQ